MKSSVHQYSVHMTPLISLFDTFIPDTLFISDSRTYSGLLTGLDPPSALQPATVLVPVITPIEGVISKPVPARPSPSPEKMPENTANPAAKQTLPARTSAMPDPAAVNDPGQNGGGGQSQSAGDPETLIRNAIFDGQRTDIGSASTEAGIKSDDAVGTYLAKVRQKLSPGGPGAL